MEIQNLINCIENNGLHYITCRLQMTWGQSDKVELDNEPICQSVEGGKEASISGYSEWLSDTSPRVTVGWDWRLDLTTGSPRYLREGMPRSNIMLIDPVNGQDLGEEATEASIAFRIDLAGLSNDAGKHITSRYS
jgi:hypothetical protein